MNPHNTAELELSHVHASLNRAADHLLDEKLALDDAVKSLGEFILEAQRAIERMQGELLQADCSNSPSSVQN